MLRDGMGIGGAHALITRKGADQHEQRTARQVEIRHQRISAAEYVPRQQI